MSKYWNNLSKRFTQEAQLRAQEARRPNAIVGVDKLVEETVWLSSSLTISDTRLKKIPPAATSAFVEWWTQEQEKLHQLKILRARLVNLRKQFHNYEALVQTEEMVAATRYLQWGQVEQKHWQKGVSDPQPQFLSPIAPHNARQYFRDRQCPSKFKWIQLAWSQPADYLMSVNYPALDSELVMDVVLDPRNFSADFVKWFYRGRLEKEGVARMEQRIAMVEPVKELVRNARLFTDHEGRRDYRALVLQSPDPYFDGQILVLSERHVRDQAPQSMVARYQDIYGYQRSLGYIEKYQTTFREQTAKVSSQIKDLIGQWIPQAADSGWTGKQRQTEEVVQELTSYHAAEMHRAAQLLKDSTDPFDSRGRRNLPAKQTKVWAAKLAVDHRTGDVVRQGGYLAEKATSVEDTIAFYERKWQDWKHVWAQDGLMVNRPHLREDLPLVAAAWWAFVEQEGFPLVEPFTHIFRAGLYWRREWENLMHTATTPTDWENLRQRVVEWVKTVDQELATLKKLEPPADNVSE